MKVLSTRREQALEAAVNQLCSGAIGPSWPLRVRDICERTEMSSAAFYDRFGDLETFQSEAIAWLLEWSVARTGDDLDVSFLSDSDDVDAVVASVKKQAAQIGGTLEQFVVALAYQWSAGLCEAGKIWPEAALVPHIHNQPLASRLEASIEWMVRSMTERLGHVFQAFEIDAGTSDFAWASFRTSMALDRPRFFAQQEIHARVTSQMHLAALRRTLLLSTEPARIMDQTQTAYPSYEPVFGEFQEQVVQTRHPVEALTIEFVAEKIGASAASLRSDFGGADSFRGAIVADLFDSIDVSAQPDAVSALHEVLLGAVGADVGIARIVVAQARHLSSQPGLPLIMDLRLDDDPESRERFTELASRTLDVTLDLVSLAMSHGGYDIRPRLLDPLVRAMAEVALFGTAMGYVVAPAAAGKPLSERDLLLALSFADLVIDGESVAAEV